MVRILLQLEIDLTDSDSIDLVRTCGLLKLIPDPQTSSKTPGPSKD